jgi:hypothetical protein
VIRKTIYTLWEPRGSMPAYIRLCMQTWAGHHPGWEIVVLDHANLGEHTGGTLDLAGLRRFPLHVQKDAIQAAVLRSAGGVFIDADTIAVGPIDPIVEALAKSELVLFGRYLAFAAARPEGVILTRWLERARQLVDQAASTSAPPREGWAVLGNEIVAEVMEDLVDQSALCRWIDVTGTIRASRPPWPPVRRSSLRGFRRLKSAFFRKLRRAIFLASCRRYLITLDPIEHGFMVEPRFYRGTGLNGRENYQRFWFHDSVDAAEVLKQSSSLIGLHNSWTPPWYASLTTEEILRNDCTLSRTLRYLT